MQCDPEFIEALESKKCAMSNLEQFNEISYDYCHPTEIEEGATETYEDVKTVISTWEHLTEYTGFISNHRKIPKNYKSEWYKDGVDLLNSGRYQEALNCFESALEENPSYVPALFEKGRCLLFLKEHKQAINVFAQVIKIDKTYNNVWHLKGFAHSQVAEYKEALLCFEQVIVTDVNKCKLLYHKAYVLFCLEKYATCIDCCDLIIKDDSKYYADARNLKNKALMKCGRYDDILREYDRRIIQDPHDTTLWYEKGVFLNKIGRYRDSINCFNRVIKNDQRDDASYFQKANALYKLALYKKALISIMSAIEIYPKEKAYFRLKNKILLKIQT